VVSIRHNVAARRSTPSSQSKRRGRRFDGRLPPTYWSNTIRRFPTFSNHTVVGAPHLQSKPFNLSSFVNLNMLCHSLIRSLTSKLLLWPLVVSAVICAGNRTAICKVIPSDLQWPSQDTWTQLNQTVRGRLIASVPEAAVCHSSGYGPLPENEAACDALKPQWSLPAV
jgi:hypothetical protein